MSYCVLIFRECSEEREEEESVVEISLESPEESKLYNSLPIHVVYICSVNSVPIFFLWSMHTYVYILNPLSCHSYGECDCLKIMKVNFAIESIRICTYVCQCARMCPSNCS